MPTQNGWSWWNKMWHILKFEWIPIHEKPKPFLGDHIGKSPSLYGKNIRGVPLSMQAPSYSFKRSPGLNPHDVNIYV